MTPPEHIVIGFSIAHVFYSIQSLLRKKILSYFIMPGVAAIFSILPDVDSFFGHYTSKNIYIGHRGITHSLLFCAIISGVLASASYFLYYFNKKFSSKPCDENIKSKCFMLFGISLFASISHLLADLPQPPGVWGGIPVLFPYRENGNFMRIGGWSNIGWYDYKILWTYFALSIASAIVAFAAHISLKRKFFFVSVFLSAMLLIINIAVTVHVIQYISDSRYINASHWENKQNEFINQLPEAMRYATIEGRGYFLYFFRKIR